MSKPGRMTISVPSELKARMEAAGEPVNWSALACRAFEAKLAEIIQIRGAKTMEDVVNRLRASKRKTGGEAYARGKECGDMWAKSHAEADDLARLDEFRDGTNQGGWNFEDWFRMDVNAPLDHAGWIAYGMLGMGDDYHDTDLAREKADEVFGEAPRDREPDHLRGFVDGALEVWHEVKDEI